MRKTANQILIACAGCLAAGAALAAPPAQPWYAGASFGSVNVNASASDFQQALVNRGYSITSVNLDEPNTGWKVFGGFRFHPNWAAELGYADLGEVKTSVTATGVTDINAIVQDAAAAHAYSADGWSLDLVGSAPVGPAEVFARAGMFRWKGEIKVRDVATGTNAGRTERGTNGHWGVGVRFPLSQHPVNLQAEWERYNVGGEWVDFLSAGVALRF